MNLLLYCFWFFKNNSIYLFLTGPGLHCCSGFFSSRGMRAPHRSGLSCCGARTPGHAGFSSCCRVLGSCGSWAHLSCSAACGNLPGPGIEPVSPALADGFFTTEPPGKPLLLFYVLVFWPVVMRILAPPLGIKPAPPALEGYVLTTGPQGKSHTGHWSDFN